MWTEWDVEQEIKRQHKDWRHHDGQGCMISNAIMQQATLCLDENTVQY
jgi:hypothetical protein